jgi:hypothetical protein
MHITNAAIARRAAAHRQRRHWELWQRFVRLSDAAGQDYPKPTSSDGRIHIIAIAVRDGRPPGWYCKNALETGDLATVIRSLDCFEPQPVGRAVAARPGSREKIRALALRAVEGVELFHADDGEREAMWPINNH